MGVGRRGLKVVFSVILYAQLDHLPVVWSGFSHASIKSGWMTNRSLLYGLHYYSLLPLSDCQSAWAMLYAWIVSDTRDFQLNINYAVNCQLLHDLDSMLSVLFQRTQKALLPALKLDSVRYGLNGECSWKVILQNWNMKDMYSAL